MDSLTEILKIGGGMGVAVAVLVALAKAGLLQVKIGKNGNGQTPHDENVTRIERNEKDIEKHEQRLEIANREMGEVKTILESHTKTFDRMETAINNIYKKLDEK